MAIVVSPVLLLAALALGGMIATVIAPMVCTAFVYLEMLTGERRLSRNPVVWVARAAAVAIVISGSAKLLNGSGDYLEFATRWTTKHLYYLEMYTDAHYGLENGRRIAHLRDGRILSAVPDDRNGFAFETETSDGI